MSIYNEQISKDIEIFFRAGRDSKAVRLTMEASAIDSRAMTDAPKEWSEKLDVYIDTELRYKCTPYSYEEVMAILESPLVKELGIHKLTVSYEI